jgi:CBS domain-containing protein
MAADAQCRQPDAAIFWTPTPWPVMPRCWPGCASSCRHLATDNDALMARFASVIDSFGESGGWWNRLLGRSDAFSSVHLKKAGIFPLVHGVRSLALARHVDTTSTVDRIEALVADGTLDAPLGREMRSCTC